MDYTLLTLSLLGLLGIMIHNLIKLNEINRKNEGTVNLIKYWKLERFSIALSVCVIVVALIARTEIKQLERVGNWLGLAFVATGYMAQSIVVSFGNRAQKYLDKQVENKPEQP